MTADLLLLLFSCVIFFASFVHGLLGLGFPLIATPLLSLYWDPKIVIAVILLPNFLINIVCAFRGNPIGSFFRQHWSLLAAYLIGTIYGSHVLLHVNQDLIRLLLVIMIALFLLQERFEHLQFLKTASRHVLAAPLVGLFAGIMQGTTNISSVPFVLYFYALGVSPLMMMQEMNFMFAIGKIVQIASLGISGGYHGIDPLAIATVTLICAVGLALGFHIQGKFSDSSYWFLMKWVLACIGIMLTLQVFII